MEKIAEVLNQKYPQFNTILYNRSVTDALFQMRCENVDYLIVLDEAENFLGLLTENDTCQEPPTHPPAGNVVSAHSRKPRASAVSGPPISVTPRTLSARR